MSISPDEFRAALGNFASGVTVVTTIDAGGHLHGITVSAFCSVSLEPPLILVCIDKTAFSHPAFEIGRFFVVNVLREDQAHLSNHFATPFADKFDHIDYRTGITGVPVLENALVSLECRLVLAHEGGDHTIFVGEIESAIINEGRPLVYYSGDYRSLKD